MEVMQKTRENKIKKEKGDKNKEGKMQNRKGLWKYGEQNGKIRKKLRV